MGARTPWPNRRGRRGALQEGANRALAGSLFEADPLHAGIACGTGGTQEGSAAAGSARAELNQNDDGAYGPLETTAIATSRSARREAREAPRPLDERVMGGSGGPSRQMPTRWRWARSWRRKWAKNADCASTAAGRAIATLIRTTCGSIVVRLACTQRRRWSSSSACRRSWHVLGYPDGRGAPARRLHRPASKMWRSAIRCASCRLPQLMHDLEHASRTSSRKPSRCCSRPSN